MTICNHYFSINSNIILVKFYNSVIKNIFFHYISERITTRNINNKLLRILRMFKVSKSTLQSVTRKPVVIKPTQLCDNRPLVILCAWAGAREKTLTAYAKMYEEMGCPSIQIGTNLTHIKGGKALAFQQTLWLG